MDEVKIFEVSYRIRLARPFEGMRWSKKYKYRDQTVMVQASSYDNILENLMAKNTRRTGKKYEITLLRVELLA